MKHTMKLQSKYFDCMKKGDKIIEVRLLDEKRRKIQIGDEIEFLKEPDRKEVLLTRVIELLVYPTFEELLELYPIENFADKTDTKENLLEILKTFYSKEEEEKYGVVGIKIELIKK